jgi:ribosome maturation factor RimP
MRKIDPVLHEKLVSLIGSMGYELIGVEMLPQGGQVVFRLYVDSPNGITVDACSKVSHQVSALFDVEDPVQGRYILEVSSPGIDRPLFELEQYQKQVGSRIKVKLYMPIDQRRQFKGILKRIEGDVIVLQIEDSDQEVSLPYSAIEKANVIGEIRL